MHSSKWSTLGRRKFMQTSAAVGFGSAASSFVTIGARAADEAEVNMQLGWLASNGILGEVVAHANGYYKELGIDFEVTPGGPGVDGVASVASGQAESGQLSSSPSLMLARSNAIPVKAMAAGYQKHPFTYFSLESDPIRSPSDMVGRTIATQPTAVILIRALLAQNGISEDDVEVVAMGSDMTQLLTGQAQAVTGWMTNTAALSVLGDDRVDLMLWDTGIQLYANVYYTTDEMLDDHSDVLTRYLTGSAQGWGFARQNPEEAVNILVETYPNLDRDSELAAVDSVLGFSFGDTTAADGWATMNQDNWQAQIDIYAALDQFEGDVPTVDDVMTLDILNATEAVRKEIG